MTIDKSIDHLNIALAFIGDSDISRWPKELLPEPAFPPKLLSHHHDHIHVHVSTFHRATSGAMMKHLPKQIKKIKQDMNSRGPFDATVFICCAGENDVSNDTPVDSIMESFQESVDAIFSSPIPTSCSKRPNLVFLGPKLEPWMTTNETDARKAYFLLSERLHASIENKSYLAKVLERRVQHDHDHDHGRVHDVKDRQDCRVDGYSVLYVDSLKLFCCRESSEDLSVVGGGAIADDRYFEEDGLHLSDEGYKIWKEEVENIVSKLIYLRFA